MVPEGLNFEEKSQSAPPAAEIVLSAPTEPPHDFFEVRMATREIPVRIEYSAMRKLRSGLKGPDSVLGLLRGTRSLEALTVEDFELIPSGHIDSKLTKLDQSVLGFFRTQSNGWAEIQENDRLIARQCFKDGDAVFLLVQNPGHRPWSAELFDLAQDGQFLNKDGAHEFYFDEYLLKNGYSAAPLDYAEPEEELEVPAGRSFGGIWVVAAAIGIIGLAGYAVTRWDEMKNEVSTLAHSRVQAPSILELSAFRSGGDIAISWNREAPSLEQSVASRIVVSDGQITRTFTLARQQLMAGRALYTPLPYGPLSGDFKIQLEVEQSTRSQSESVLVAALREVVPTTDAVSEFAGKLRTATGAEAVLAGPLQAVAESLPANVPQAAPPPISRPSTPAPPVTPENRAAKLPSLSQLEPSQPPEPPAAIVREFPKLTPAAQSALSAIDGGKLLLSVRVSIDEGGNVTSASILPPGTNADPAIQSAALDAARQWKYKPGSLAGKAVASEATITFTFQ